MNSIMNIASSAWSALSVQQDVTANNVANVTTDDFKTSSARFSDHKNGGVSASVLQGNDRVEISQEAVNMIAKSNAYTANLKSVQTDDEMQQTLFSTFSTKA